MEGSHDPEVSQVRHVACQGVQKRNDERGSDSTEDGDLASGLCKTGNVVFGQVTVVYVDALEGTARDDGVSSLGRAHEVD